MFLIFRFSTPKKRKSVERRGVENPHANCSKNTSTRVFHIHAGIVFGVTLVEVGASTRARTGDCGKETL